MKTQIQHNRNQTTAGHAGNRDHLGGFIGVVMLALSYWQIKTYQETDSTQNLIIGSALVVLGVFLLTTSLAGIWSSRKGKLILRKQVISLVSSRVMKQFLTWRW
jgi:uncharacterized membrane protein